MEYECRYFWEKKTQGDYIAEYFNHELSIMNCPNRIVNKPQVSKGDKLAIIIPYHSPIELEIKSVN